MIQRNHIAFILIIISLVLLIPGLTQPMVTINAQVDILGFDKEIFRETRSIWQTITGLFQSDNAFVAFLILLFSVLVPFIKAIMLMFVLKTNEYNKKNNLYSFVRNISKWSMADVFVVGIFIAFLSAKAMDNLDGQLEVGFYFFTAYCLVSLLSVQFMTMKKPEQQTAHITLEQN